MESKGRQRETIWSSLAWCHENDRRAGNAGVEENQRAAKVEDIPTEMREEPLKALEQSTQVEEMPIRALGAVSKTDGRIVSEESMVMVYVSLRVDARSLFGSALRTVLYYRCSGAIE